ncbi:hypothetical protein BKA70DRAFT_1285798 [Coprinopsis sp. MPI-PUGE-AT-0042]|nr:hypothetical protein BKA70DRAFT_1285798 [Coprinopsis sp. MPI-PUGE-AT-0042]
MLKRTGVVFTGLIAFVTLAEAQDDVITLYAPSLRSAPSASSSRDTQFNYVGEYEVINKKFHLGGKIEGASAIGYSHGDATWYVGVHQYSVVVTTTGLNQFTTVTLPTPKSKTVTFRASPTDLVYLGGRVDIHFGPDRDLSGILEYKCSHDVDENVPADEGIVVCEKLYAAATAPIPEPVGDNYIVEVRTIGHAIPIATITVAPNLALPTLVEVSGSLSTAAPPLPPSSGSGYEVRIGWSGFIASIAILLVCSFL